MDGGCINIWLKKPLDSHTMLKLENFARDVDKYLASFSVRFKKPAFNNLYIKYQSFRIFGSVPQQEIYCCGFADIIFMTAEQILRHFGGYLLVGIGESREKIDGIPGVSVEIYETPIRKLIQKDHWKFLVDFKFIQSYFSKNIDDYLTMQYYFDKQFNS